MAIEIWITNNKTGDMFRIDDILCCWKTVCQLCMQSNLILWQNQTCFYSTNVSFMQIRVTNLKKKEQERDFHDLSISSLVTIQTAKER